MNDARTGRAERGGRRGRTNAALTAIVVVWWLLIAGAVVLTLPQRAASAPRASVVYVAGQTARIHQPGMASWPIPVERLAFDESRRGFREGDEAAIDHAFDAFAWIQVSHHEAVRILVVDGDAIQVELLDGRSAGHRGWLTAKHLTP